MSIYYPGQRVVIRDAEWVIRRVDMVADSGYQLSCEGISNFVKGKESIFLTSYEKNILVIDPAKTKLIPDTSSSYERSALYIESLMRELVPTDDKIYRGQKAAMDVVNYQFDPALQALKQPRQRILMGDAVGLGKTLEAGILVSELMKRGKGKRILVLAVKSMLTQFQKEFWNRFSIPLTRLDSQGIQQVRNKIPANMNPFFYYDKSIISIDTLKQEALYRSYIEEAYWDIIIIDEAHNVADRNSGSQKSKLAKLISSRCDTLLMLSATPHDGSAKSFASLLNMLDPTAIANPNDYGIDDFKDKGLVIRRFKKDIQDQVQSEFKQRKIFVDEGRATASMFEEMAFETLSKLKFETIDANKRKGSDLFKTTLIKSLMSSPVACISSINERLKKLENKDEDYSSDIEALEELRDQLAQIDASSFSKYQRLVELITKTMKWKKSVPDDRLVIFTERIKTLEFLKEHLIDDLNLNDEQLVTMTGSMSDVDVNKIVEDFGQEDSRVRVLIATDVASEGINLHYLSHRLIHFDIPWSLMVFQQRNGRVDRYGQEKEPEIYYMTTKSENKNFLGDDRILQILGEKDQQAYRNIGDPSAFFGVYNPEDEEKKFSEWYAEGISIDEISKKLDANLEDDEFDFFAELEDSQERSTDSEEMFKEFPTLFKDDLSYATTALKYMEKQQSLGVRYEDDRISFNAPKDLEYRFKMLPREVWPKDGYFILSSHKPTINKEIKNSRKSESSWPQIHYLWEQHPVLEWVRGKLLSNFDRLEAPLITLNTIKSNESIFIVSGLIPNKKAHPLINHWMGICFENGNFTKTLTMNEVIEQTNFGKQTFANRDREVDTNSLEKLLPTVIDQAKKYMLNEFNQFEEEINEKLNEQYKELELLKERHMEQYGLFHNDDLMMDADGRRIKKIFDEYFTWIEETMTPEKEPYIQVIAALNGEMR